MRHAVIVPRADTTKKVLARSLLGALVVVVAVLCALTLPKLAGAAPSYPMTIDNTTFPNETFRQYVIDNISGGDTTLTQAEAEEVESIVITNKSITTLKGIELFSNLTSLTCYYNNLTALDLSKNTALRYLNCLNNNLTALDLSKNTALYILSCSYNNLVELDVSNNTILTYLDCFHNNLAELNASHNPALSNGFYCNDNNLVDVIGSLSAGMPGIQRTNFTNQTRTIAVTPDPDTPGSYLSEDTFGFYAGHSIAIDSASYDVATQRFSTTALDTDLAFTTYLGPTASGSSIPDYTLAGTIKFVLAPPLYTLGSGEHAVGADASLTFTTERSMNVDGFTRLLVDGDGTAFADLVRTNDTTFEGANAIVTEGSTVVVLKSTYLDTLTVGSHSITLLYSDGLNVSGTFTVAAATGTGEPNGTAPDTTLPSTIPATGDGAAAALVALGTLAALVGGGLLLRRRTTAR